MSFSLLPVALLAAFHAYIGSRLLGVLPAPWGLAGAGLLVGLFLLVLSAASPILGRRAATGVLAWAGLIAMGFFSTLLVLTLGRDAVLVAWGGWNLATGAAPIPLPVLQVSALAVPALAFVASLLGLLNARRRPGVRRVDVPIADLPPALEGFTLVQISDLHVGPTIRKGFVDRVVDAANALDADVMALTGDLVDGRVPELSAHTAPLGRLQARHGVFAVTGNHEYYSGAPAWVAELRRLGITVLMNEHLLLKHGAGRLLLAGVTDFGAHHFDEQQRSDPARAMRGASDEAHAKVLLAHQPRSAAAAAEAGFDLQLSGHTHGGQFLPWNLFVPLQQPFVAGLHRLGALWVYVSRGTGYWGPPKRLGAPSEITRLRLVRA
ncbi:MULTISPECIES: metallophosphoesterase [unclassified Rhizobacter]|uniref:metallophosphoesterase n=1 Tax=unclassified Rhizobacter TaxID=2640088 RepID=UPI0006FB0A8A|nr:MULTISPECIES: metallophosphoesterase [unclassified Rhizobacter]KQU65080.1 serine/threonine protein phosphatase [Rhizobacter sp. Root29]KQW00675.1 serine/threonine protein phosphatase [Rhizobacter sp. Root1238]KRB09917.1 serine/threonine protein phosphatase [Rhizobacter sp. Root16D2]